MIVDHYCLPEVITYENIFEGMAASFCSVA